MGEGMRAFIAAIALLIAASTVADARTRVTVNKKRPIVKHPYAIEYVLSYIFCGFHVFSVGPQPKPGQLGECASWFNYVQPRHGAV